MTIHNYDISLQTSHKDSKKQFVRISIGEYMFFDSPETTPEHALVIYKNLLDECDCHD